MLHFLGWVIEFIIIGGLGYLIGRAHAYYNANIRARVA
jgi:hypothetical protein